MTERSRLDATKLQEFQPRAQPQERPVAPRELDAWPSREPVREAQINVRGDADTINRFKKLCKDDRRTYIDMLRIIMDTFEGRAGGL